nr:LicD family protein [uncultured Psychrobacter sp.]
MDILQQTLLETLQEFHSFCEEHRLRYFLIGGSLLGAVRHKGFIPWDDDIDVAMPRTDYDRFLDLSHNIKPPFIVKSPKFQKDYRYQTTKFTNESLMVEEDAYKPIVTGAWLDIFPLDYTFDNKYLQKIHFFINRRIVVLIPLKYDVLDIDKLSEKNRVIAPYIKSISKIIPRGVINCLLDINSIVPRKFFRRKNYLANLNGAWGIKEVAPKEIFDSRKLYEFESKLFFGPKEASFWLTKVYGEFMQLPPERDRQSHHNIVLLPRKLIEN